MPCRVAWCRAKPLSLSLTDCHTHYLLVFFLGPVVRDPVRCCMHACALLATTTERDSLLHHSTTNTTQVGGTGRERRRRRRKRRKGKRIGGHKLFLLLVSHNQQMHQGHRIESNQGSEIRRVCVGTACREQSEPPTASDEGLRGSATAGSDRTNTHRPYSGFMGEKDKAP